MKRFISCLLAAVMALSLMAGGMGTAAADDVATVTIETSDIDLQLSLLYTQLGKLKQTDGENPWYYTVTDLDHDGNLEFIAATLHPRDRSTNLKVWEISEDRKSLAECRLAKDEDESFPDIMTDVADTFHDTKTDTWSYLFYDNIVLSDDEVYTIKTGVSLKDGVIDYDAFAVQHTVASRNNRSVSFTDAVGIAISPEQYNAAGSNAYAGTERSSTNFAWMTEKDLGTLTRVIDSYAVFAGTKKPTEAFPVPRPAALEDESAKTPETPAATPSPAATPVPAQEVKYLSITKNPTNENRKAKDTALFVACANAFESLSWTLVSPAGGEFSVPNFRSYFNANVSGEYSTTLSIADVKTDMNGWGAYCTFYYRGQTARTSTAYLYVQKPQESSGVFYGTVTGWTGTSISVNLDGRSVVAISRKICTVSGDLYVGAPATVTWNGYNSKQERNYTSCEVIGSQPSPAQDGGVYYGYVADWNYSSVSVNLDGTTTVALPWDICSVSGEIYVGAPATAIWQGTTTKGLNFVSCSIVGREPAPQPVYGSMSGTAHEGGGGFAINLMNGQEVFADSWICSVSGVFYDGAPCTVYYTEPLSSSTVYQVDIYGGSPAPEPEPQPIPDPSPVESSISGRAFRDIDDDVFLTLDNGSQIYVDIDICNLYGELVMAGAGNPCTVYYYDYPTSASITRVDVFPAEDPVG